MYKSVGRLAPGATLAQARAEMGRIASDTAREPASWLCTSPCRRRPLGVQFEIPFTIDGLAATSPSERPRARYRGVMPGYLEVMAIPLRAGGSRRK